MVERNRGADHLILFGVWERGAKLAERIAAYINQIENSQVLAVPLDVNPFREPPQPLNEAVEAVRISVEGKDVILVDDVLFSGQTARAALDALKPFGRPRSVQLAVLIDRGHRTWPLQPDYAGRFIPTKHQEQILVDEHADFAVFLEE